MKKKNIIRKILVLVAWTAVICGITVLLVAANRKEKLHACESVIVSLKSSSDPNVTETDIKIMLAQAAPLGIVGRPVSSLNLPRLETALERNDWIRNAEIYFDSRDVLHVLVSERIPVARIFTVNGNSFYIDSAAHKIPLTGKTGIRLPVVTGYPDLIRRNATDSSLVINIKNIINYINNNNFWDAQVGQIDITPRREFDLVPVIGDHIISLGDGSDVEEKLDRLRIFYTQVLAKTGFDKYSFIDLSYRGQVVARKAGPVSAVDSIQLMKNIEALMLKSSLQQPDSSMLPDQ